MPIDNSKYTLLLILSTFEDPDGISALLQEEGFHVCGVADRQEAVHQALEDAPDLILLDMDGSVREETAMLRGLKNTRTTCPVPVLFMVTMADEHFLRDCFVFDNVDFISKPFQPQELVIRIQRQLLLARAVHTIRQQNEKLKRTLAARDKLYSVIAHDLRAPIGTIKMINASIESQKELIKNAKISKLFEMIHETTEEAFNLLENLLRWTRNQTGKTKLYATDFNLTIAVRQVVSLFSAMAEAKDIVVGNHVCQNFYVYADEDMVKTVLRNLFSNALKFTYPGGHVDIDVSDVEDSILVSVKDNGKGIAKDMQPRLLKSAGSITTCGTRNEKGSGLGLVLSRDFIKMNKGKFWFVSREGVGTAFYFTLPKSPAGAYAPEESR